MPYRIIGQENDTLYFLYDASGGLLQRRYSKAGQVINKIDYLNGVEIVNGSLEALYHKEGRVRKEGSSWLNDYYLSDHLGNVRSVFSDENGDGFISSSEVKQRNDYYAFGLEQKGASLGNFGNTKLNRFKYNGKEVVEEMQLSLSLYGARFYDPSIGRWNVVDALADEPEQIDKSPFAYAWNNPVKLTDPDGNCPRCIKAALKTVVKSVAKGKVDLGEFYDIAESVGTLVDGNLNMADVEAVFNLVSPVSTKEIKAGAKAVEGVLDATKSANKAKGGVYVLKDADDKVVRTGRTKDLNKRKDQHASNEETKDLRFEESYRTDNYNEQRGLEKVVYDKNPQARSSNGGLNKIKPISDKNKNKPNYENAANEYLKTNGGG